MFLIWNYLFLCFTCIKQMPHGDGRLPSHSVSSQYRMHSYYPAATYLTQGLGSTSCVPPFFSLDDNNNSCSETMAACEWHTTTPDTHFSGSINLYPDFINSTSKGGLHSNPERHKMYFLLWLNFFTSCFWCSSVKAGLTRAFLKLQS